MEKKENIKEMPEEEKSVSESQVKKEKKIFLVIVLMMVGLAAVFAAVYFISDSFNHFKVEEVKFTVDKITMTGLTLYKTSIPGTISDGVFSIDETSGKKADYNFWLRENPKKTIKNIPFEGNLIVMKDMVLNQEGEFACDGDYIGIQNLLNLYREVIGVKVIADKNATCDGLGRYVFVDIISGNETRIDQTGKTCYEIQVKDCEILPATERFMIETLIKTNQYIKGN